MKAKVTILVIISIILVSCKAQSTDTLMSDFSLATMVQGKWLVETVDIDKDWTTLGTLVIDGNSYRFHSTPDVEIPAWMRDRFCFFERPAGEVGFEYEPNVFPSDDVRTFEDQDILLRWAGLGCEETFLVRVDQESQELYLHAQVSEIQQYRIHKSYTK